MSQFKVVGGFRNSSRSPSDYWPIFARRTPRAWWPQTGRTSINTQALTARRTDSIWIRACAIAIPVLLLAPAIWNGYPLLQWDTGGYLARWDEGYLVPSRSTR